MPKRPPPEPGHEDPFDWAALWGKVERWLIGGLAHADVRMEVRRLPIEDGDIVVMTCDQHLTAEMHRMIVAHVQHVIEQSKRDAKVLVLDKGFDIKVVGTGQLPRIKVEQSGLSTL